MFKNLLQLGALSLASTVLLAQSEDQQDPRTPTRVQTAGGEFDTTSPTVPTAPTSLDFGRVPIHTAQPDPEGGEYGVWAVGETYKVSFHDLPTFIPYLGSAAPHNMPLSWRLQSVTVGGRALVNPGDTPVRRNTEYRYEYQYGKVTEAYDVLELGLEQTFTVHQRPEVIGDLVVTMRIESPLQIDEFAAAHRSMDLRGPDGRVHIRYSEAFVLDAAGRKAPALTSHDGGTLRLSVSADWLRDATFPVVVDPLSTRVEVSGGSLRESPDIARDDDDDQVIIVYTRVASAPDRDGYARVFDDCFPVPNGTRVWTDVNTWDTTHMRAACLHRNTRKFIITLERRFSSGARRVRYHVRDVGDLVESSQYNFWVPASGFNDHRPDVGGTTWETGGDKAVIVYQQEDNGVTAYSATNTSSIYYRIVDVSGGSGSSATHGSKILVPKRASGTDAERPTVNSEAQASTTQPSVWICVWQEFDNSFTNDDWDAIGRQIDDTGSVSTSRWIGSDASADVHKMGLTIDGRDGRYLVAYSRADSTLGKLLHTRGTMASCERLDWPNAGSLTNFPVTDFRNSSDLRWRVGRCGHDWDTDSHWVVPAISDQVTGPGTGNIYLHRFGYHGWQLESVTLHLNSTTTNNQLGYDAAVYYDDDANLYQVCYAANADPTMSNPTLNSVYGNCYTYDAPSGPPTTSGFSCSGATISLSGNNAQQIGHEFIRVNVNGAPANSAHFLAVSMAGANLPSPFPPCRVLVALSGPAFIGIADLRVGSSVFWILPLPEFLNSSNTLYFQDWHTDSPPVTQFFSTQRLVVPIVK